MLKMFSKKLFKKSAVLFAATLMLVGAVTVGTKCTTKASVLKYHLDGKNGKITMVNSSYEYTGEEVKPSYKVYYKSKVLKEGTDFKASYSNNVEPGTATVTVTGVGNYVGKKSASFVVKQKPSKIAFDGKQFFAVTAVKKNQIESVANKYLTNPKALTHVDGSNGTNGEVFMIFPKRNDVKFTVQRLYFDGNLTPSETLAKNITGGAVIYSEPVEFIPHLQVVAVCDGKTVTLPLTYNYKGDGGIVSIPNPEYVKDVTP